MKTFMLLLLLVFACFVCSVATKRVCGGGSADEKENIGNIGVTAN